MAVQRLARHNTNENHTPETQPVTIGSAPQATNDNGKRLSGHVLELDGFRAIAVWLVLFDHMVDGWPLPKQAVSWIPALPWQIISHGWLGVDLFFVLSGFLITGILLDSRGGENYFRNFYGRRALRIIPLYFTCIAIMYLGYGGSYFLLSLLFLANFAPAFNVATPHGPGVFWSLSIEEHFYLLWPLAVRFLNRKALLIVAITIVVGSPVLRWWAMGQGLSFGGIYQYSFYRSDGLALGACLAMWARSRFFTKQGAFIVAGTLIGSIGIATVLALPYGVFGSGSQMGVALRSTQAQFLFASAVAVALTFRNTLFTAPLRWRFAVLSAKLSYCLYLIHLSVGDLYYWLLTKFNVHELELWSPVEALFIRSVVIIGVSFVLAALSQKYLEAPFMKLRKYFA